MRTTRAVEVCAAARHSGRYDELVGAVAALHARGDDEPTLTAIRRCANHAWFHHPGRFADGRLENVALEIGGRLERALPATSVRELRGELEPGGASSRRVLHVVSRALETGGHTKLVMSWIELDRSSEHSVLLSFQSHQPFRADLAPLVRRHGGGFVRLPVEFGNLDAAAAVRFAAGLEFDLVVLHANPDDPFATVALARPGGPPVLLVDHADHCFWLGSSVADMTVHLRQDAERRARERRFVRRTAHLPNPLPPPSPALSVPAARTRLGLAPEGCLLLSVGSAYKWRSIDDTSFVLAAGEVLDALPGASLHLLGIGPTELATAHPRVVAHGVLDAERVALFQAAADVFLEPYPFGSMTATLEAVLAGCRPVLGPVPGPPILIGAGDELERLVGRPADEREWIQRAIRAGQAGEPPPDLGSVADVHAGPTWRSRVASLYARAATIDHAPRPIPAAEERNEAEDRRLTRFCEVHTEERA